MANVYTGQVQNLCSWDGTDPSAFCRAVLDGTLTIDEHNVVAPGIGGQLHKRGGTLEVTLEATCVGIASDDIAQWFPTAVGTTVSSFTRFLVECDDSGTGQEFDLNDGQPASITIELGDAEDAEVTYNITAKFATPDLVAAGTNDAATYNSFLGHTHNDIGVTIGDADNGLLSFSLTNDLGLQMNNPAVTKEADAKRFPDGYVVTQSDVGLSMVTTETVAANLLDDTLTEADIAIAMANGTGGEDITITCGSFSPDNWNMPLAVQDRTGFAHEYSPGDGETVGRVVFT